MDSRSRRSYLGAVGAALAGALAGCSRLGGGHTTHGNATGTGTGERTPVETDDAVQRRSRRPVADREGFGTVVDVVDAGADPTGEEPITPVLREVAGDDTLVTFPEGRYRMESQFRLTGFENFGLRGEGATIAPATIDHFDEPRCFKLGVTGDAGTGLLFEGFDVDVSPANVGVKAIQAVVDGGLRVRDVTIRGRHDTAGEAGGTFIVPDPTGYGVVKRFRFPGGTTAMRTRSGRPVFARSGITVNRRHLGTLWFEDCVVNHCHDNGMYVKGGGGKIVVQGGRFANNNVSNVRISGRNSSIRNVEVVVDENPRGFRNQRGIRVDGGSNVLLKDVEIALDRPNGQALTIYDDVESATIVDTHVRIANRPEKGVVVQPRAGSTRVTDATVEMAGGTGGPAIDLQGPGPGDATAQVLVESVAVAGEAAGDAGEHPEAVRCARPHTEFRNVTLDRSGPGDGRGIRIDADGCTVVDSDLTARGYPLVLGGDRLRVVDTDCRALDGGPSLLLEPTAADVDLVDCTVANGVRDRGATGVSRRGNRYPE